MPPKKNIEDGKFLRIYGPYPDKRDASKWTVHVYPQGSAKPIIVPTFGFDLSKLYEVIRSELFKNVVERAGAPSSPRTSPE
jgi:hypothetical protein